MSAGSVARRAAPAARAGWVVLRRSVEEFFEDRCPQAAAAISYYALFALFPLAILAVSVFGIAVADDAARERVIDFLLRNLPLQPDEGRDELGAALEGVTENAGAFGAIGVAGLIFSASGLMAAVRNGVNTAWDVDERRPAVRGRAFDLLLVLAVGTLVGASLALTLVFRLVAPFGGLLGEPLGALTPALLAFAVFAFLYRLLPAREVSLRDVWPGALLAAAGYELAKIGFSIYLESFASYSAVYGSLAAVVAFLFFAFLAANIFLLGAEVGSEWRRGGRMSPRPRSGKGSPDGPLPGSIASGGRRGEPELSLCRLRPGVCLRRACPTRERAGAMR